MVGKNETKDYSNVYVQLYFEVNCHLKCCLKITTYLSAFYLHACCKICQIYGAKIGPEGSKHLNHSVFNSDFFFISEKNGPNQL